MQTLLGSSKRVLSATLISCVIVGISACASKNPLMQDTAATPNSTSAAGLQTSKERRLFGIFSPYRNDVQQGNFVSREMLAQLQEGIARNERITPEQVRFVLGTPLLTEIFHANRWDYIFRLEKGNGEVIMSRVTVFFNNGQLTKLDGGELPNEKDYLTLIAAPKK